jgi:hypothetical protein
MSADHVQKRSAHSRPCARKDCPGLRAFLRRADIQYKYRPFANQLHTEGGFYFRDLWFPQNSIISANKYYKLQNFLSHGHCTRRPWLQTVPLVSARNDMLMHYAAIAFAGIPYSKVRLVGIAQEIFAGPNFAKKPRTSAEVFYLSSCIK